MPDELEPNAQVDDCTVVTKTCPECGKIGCNCRKQAQVDESGAAALPTGSIFMDRFEIISVLGKGGMGVVYKAKQTYLKSLVAIKMLTGAGSANEENVLRFQNEGQAASGLNHKNIATVRDFGVDGEKRPYLVMDFVEGKSLAVVIREEGALDLKRVVRIFQQVADAMDHAHHKHVLHRDLKPGNIMLSEDPDEGKDFVKIVDFGIAKLMHDNGESQIVTKHGEVFGSPYYMSPEQCMGKVLDGRSDIYAVGCVMYEAATGELPFAGENTVETMYSQMHDRVLTVSEVRPDVYYPDEIEDIIEKCLEKDPKNRYESMAALKADLDDLSELINQDQFQKNKPKKRKRHVPYSLRRQLRPVWTALGLTAVTGLACIGYVGFLFFEEHRIVGQYLDPAAEQEKLHHFREAETSYMRALAEAQNLPYGYPVQWIVLEHLGQFYQGQGKFDFAAQRFKEALELRLAYPLKFKENIGNNYYYLGSQYKFLAEQKNIKPLVRKQLLLQAQEQFEQALSYYKMQTNQQPPLLDDLLVYYIQVEQDLGHQAKADELKTMLDKLPKDPD